MDSKTYEITINRADNVMVRRIDTDWFEIAPEILVKFILFGLRNGFLKHRMITEQILEIIDVEERVD